MKTQGNSALTEPTQPDPSIGARLSVMLATGITTVIVVSYLIFAIALVVGGDAAISDTWVGSLAGYALIAGLAISLVAFFVAVVAEIRHESWKPLRLPLALFPTLLALIILAEFTVLQ
ncbi:unannotated protein [freshwater metagenome]|uniref:Unannotated protein n=1 Tax=freshwater metagenome TaxID=449393 RepID=A0A6J6D4X4_9ZZZZ